MSRTSAIVVGGGVGGLAAAIHLARAGLPVRLLERGPRVGGKLQEVTLAGRTLCAGPSVITMRHVFEELFGGALERYLTLIPVDPLCRHFFPDGSVLDLHADEARSRAAIERFSGPREAEGFTAFRKHAAKIYEIVRGPFMEQPVLSLKDLFSPRVLLAMPHIDGLKTLWNALGSYFTDPRLRQLFARYATYNGSSPYHAPGTLAVIAHVEHAFGVWACEGGIYRLAEGLAQLARDLGVEIVTGAVVDEILVENGRAVGVRLADAGEARAGVVVCNCDAAHVFGRLLRQSKPAELQAEKYAASELSLSAYLLLCVARRAPLDLAHHNVFFSGDYRREFEELVTERRPPEAPTVYLCAEDRLSGAVPEIERLVFLTNAPPLDARGAQVDWTREAPACQARVTSVLARFGWTLDTVEAASVTPAEFASRFPSSRGALYGLASNSRLAAFKRPPNRLPGVSGLYLVGGTVHPGAGLPMVCLSARIATRMALQDLAA